MEKKNLVTAAQDVAVQVAASLRGLEQHLDKDQIVYVYTLVVTDDLANCAGYANTESHFAGSDGGPLQKWYFAEWVATGMDIDTQVLNDQLGDPTDDAPQIQAAWLFALMEGLKLCRSQGSLTFRGRPVYGYCSMSDSGNAIWIERETSKVVNPSPLLPAIDSELAAASAAWYGSAPRPASELELAFQDLRSL